MIAHTIHIQFAWFDLAHNRDNFMAVVNVVMNFCVILSYSLYIRKGNGPWSSVKRAEFLDWPRTL